MSKELISLETAIEWAKAEIEIEGEDFIYGADRRESPDSTIDCFYYEPDGTPSCIVGRILDRHGLMTFENAPTSEGQSAHRLPQVNENFTEEAQGFLVNLQMFQDEGKPWGLALECAIEDSKLD